MNIWIMLWVFLTIFIFGTFLWTVQILLRQKTVWEQFSKRHNLDYSRNTLLKSPSLKGMFRDIYVSVFSSEVEGGSRGTKKFRTVVQFDLKPGMLTEGVIASAGYRNFALGLGIPKEYVPEAHDWNKEILIRCRDTEAVAAYFTPERVKVINAVFSIKNCNTILLFDVGEMFFRFETPDPLDDISRMEKLITKVVDAAKVLQLSGTTASHVGS